MSSRWARADVPSPPGRAGRPLRRSAKRLAGQREPAAAVLAALLGLVGERLGQQRQQLRDRIERHRQRGLTATGREDVDLLLGIDPAQLVVDVHQVDTHESS